MSQNNSIKKLLNIKNKFLKIDKIFDENIKGTLIKVIYATATKKIIPVHAEKNKLVKNGFKRINFKMLKPSHFNTLLRVVMQRYLCKNCKKYFKYIENFSFFFLFKWKN